MLLVGSRETTRPVIDGGRVVAEGLVLGVAGVVEVDEDVGAVGPGTLGATAEVGVGVGEGTAASGAFEHPASTVSTVSAVSTKAATPTDMPHGTSMRRAAPSRGA